MNPTKTHRLLTIPEAAEALSLKPSTIRAWISQRRIPHVKLGRAVRVPAKDVEQLIERNTVPARPWAGVWDD